MTRIAAAIIASAAMFLGACRSDPVAQPTPAPTVGPAGQVPAGVLPPVDRARDSVSQLNDLQDRVEQQTGGNGYAP